MVNLHRAHRGTSPCEYEKFKGWLEVNPVLRPLLTLNQRTYTPAQVALIIDQLCEPEEWV